MDPFVPAVGTTHHVRIGNVYCMLDSYRKRPAPIRGARVATGDRDWSDLSIWQRWVQHCWAGGIGADKWVDDSMFDSAVGTDSTVHEQLSLSRDLEIAAGGELNAQSRNSPRKFHIHRRPGANQKPQLYCVSTPATGNTHLWRYNRANNTWTLIWTFNGVQATSITSHSGELVIGLSNGRIRSAEAPANGPWAVRNPPKGEKAGVTAMMRYRQRLYVAYGKTVYRRKWNWKVDGKTEFYDANEGGAIICMETHLGFLYMGSQGGHIHRTDGNNTFDIWSWDGGTRVVSMRSFDGRLFVGTYEFNDADDVGFGGIYQLTGSAVTLLKRWGLLGKSTTIGDFTVYDRKLFYGAANLWGMNRDDNGDDHGGFGVAVYDGVEDAHSIWASNKDTVTYPDSSGTGVNWIVDDVIWWQGQMHAAVRGHGNFITPVTYRDYLQTTVNYDKSVVAAGGGASAGFLVSSIYDGGTPGLLKMWRQFSIEANMDNNNVSVAAQYSIDKGDTWVTLGTLQRILTGTLALVDDEAEVEGTGTLFTIEVEPGDELDVQGQIVTVTDVVSDTELVLSAPAVASVSGTAFHTKENFVRDFPFGDVRSSRMQYRLLLDSSSGTQSPFVTGIVISYLPIPEPNWVWDLTVWVADRFVMLDGQEDPQDEETQFDTLAGYFRDQILVEFEDRDGTIFADEGKPGVIIWDYNEDWHLEAKQGEPTEGLIRLTLLEVHEDYPIEVN